MVFVFMVLYLRVCQSLSYINWRFRLHRCDFLLVQASIFYSFRLNRMRLDVFIYNSTNKILVKFGVFEKNCP